MEKKDGPFKLLTEELLGAIRIAKKDMGRYYFKPPVTMMGFFFPGFTYLAFTVGRSIEPTLLIPGLVAITSFFAGGSIGPAVLPLERKTRTLERLLGAPISPFAITLGKTFAGSAFGLIMSLVPLLIGVTLIGMQIADLLLLIPGVVLSALTFAAFGIMFSSRAQEMSSGMVPMNLIRLPMLFVSGVFVPLKAMPGALRSVSYLMPLTYSVDAMRQTMLGPVQPLTLLGDVVALTVFLVLFLGVATKALRRDTR
jgi:ABC-2 type transport system permease protein